MLQGPLISSPSVRPAISPPSPNPVQNPNPLARQRSMKRGSGGSNGGSSGSSSGSSTPVNGGAGPTLQPQASNVIAQSSPERQTAPEPSPRGSRTGGLAPQPHGGGEQHRGYGSNRRGNNGGGSHHNHGNRRDQEWNHHRNAHLQHPQQQQRGGGGIRSYPRPPPPVVSAPFVGPPPPVRPFVGNAMGFPDVPPLYFVTPQPPPESIRAMTFVPHPVPPMFFPVMDPQRAQLLKQIDYYFSSENLCKDPYLRQNMDDQGWVPISLIATFNRVKQLTNSIKYIVDTVKLSTIVEVQGEKIRRRNDWMHWLLLPSNRLGSTSGGQSLTSSDYDAVAARFQNIALEEATTNHIGMRGPIRADIVLTRSASGNLNNQFQVVGDPSRDGSGQFTGVAESDRLRSIRSLSRSDTL